MGQPLVQYGIWFFFKLHVVKHLSSCTEDVQFDLFFKINVESFSFPCLPGPELTDFIWLL